MRSRIPKKPLTHNRRSTGRVRWRHRIFIRSLPCAVCDHPGPCEAAHVRAGTNSGGMGLKPEDRFLVPLCHEHHVEQHAKGEKSFWASRNIDPLNLAARLWAVTGDMAAGIRAIMRTRQAIALHKAENDARYF